MFLKRMVVNVFSVKRTLHNDIQLCYTYNMKGVRKMAQINFRIDDELKEESKEIFDSLGIDLTTGIKIFLTKVVREKGIPLSLIHI